MYFTLDTQNAIIEHQGINIRGVKHFNTLEGLRSGSVEAYLTGTYNTYVTGVITHYEKKKAKGKEIELSYVDMPEFVSGHVPVNWNNLTVQECEQVVSSSKEECQTIYQTRIQSAFDKLAENLIFVHNFLSLHDTFEILKADCVSFLYEAIPKYKADKGRAFAYYNIIAKNFLIIRSKQRQTKIKRNVSIDDHDALGFAEKQALEEWQTVPSPDDQVIAKENRDAIQKLLIEIRVRFTSELELKVIDCIQMIFNNAQHLPYLNKRAVFQYIREITDITPKQLTTAMSNIKKEYRKLRNSDDFGIF